MWNNGLMFNPDDIHIVLIGNDRQLDYRINLEILRYNFVYGDQLWITTVYNGDEDRLPSGIGENSFIHIKENRGYGLGALDAFNEGLGYASIGYRPIVVLFNFDVWFFTDGGFKLWVEDFQKSRKSFGAGLLPDHELPMTDCMIFKKDMLNKILPIEDKVLKYRQEDKRLVEMYEDTQLGFYNMEEFMLYSIQRSSADVEINDMWWQYQRDGAPRYRWTEKYTLAHSHDYEERKQLLKKYEITKGRMIPEFLNQ